MNIEKNRMLFFHFSYLKRSCYSLIKIYLKKTRNLKKHFVYEVKLFILFHFLCINLFSLCAELTISNPQPKTKNFVLYLKLSYFHVICKLFAKYPNPDLNLWVFYVLMSDTRHILLYLSTLTFCRCKSMAMLLAA